jgi:parafibromin
MYNVKKFLQESTFESSDSARARAQAEGNLRPDDVIFIDRRLSHIESSGKETVFQQKYVVVDSQDALTKFGPDAWDRVVCVMTTGQAWQFRPYKWSEPKVLFHHGNLRIRHHLFLQANTKIKDWNVMELKVFGIATFQSERSNSDHRLINKEDTLTKVLWHTFGKRWMTGCR